MCKQPSHTLLPEALVQKHADAETLDKNISCLSSVHLSLSMMSTMPSPVLFSAWTNPDIVKAISCSTFSYSLLPPFGCNLWFFLLPEFLPCCIAFSARCTSVQMDGLLVIDAGQILCDGSNAHNQSKVWTLTIDVAISLLRQQWYKNRKLCWK